MVKQKAITRSHLDNDKIKKNHARHEYWGSSFCFASIILLTLWRNQQHRPVSVRDTRVKSSTTHGFVGGKRHLGASKYSNMHYCASGLAQYQYVRFVWYVYTCWGLLEPMARDIHFENSIIYLIPNAVIVCLFFLRDFFCGVQRNSALLPEHQPAPAPSQSSAQPVRSCSHDHIYSIDLKKRRVSTASSRWFCLSCVRRDPTCSLNAH